MEIIGHLTLPLFLQLLGFLILFKWFFFKPIKVAARWLMNICNGSNASEKILHPVNDDFAIVTGCTSGIGLEYARQLAEKGYNLLLLSRSESKLQRVAEEIQRQYPQSRRVEYLAVDFSQTDIYDCIEEKIHSLNAPIHVLVNNVGIMPKMPTLFTEHPHRFHLKLIMVNIVSVTLMTEIVIKAMRNQKPALQQSDNRASGVIINLSSLAGLSEYPLLASYSASKSYINFLSKSLATEYADEPYNIIVQTVTPGVVDTPLATHYHEKGITVSARSFVRYALRTVGSESVTNGHPVHKVVNGLTGSILGLMNNWLAMQFKLFVTKRTRAKYDRKVKPVNG